jgi:hypothetical protein
LRRSELTILVLRIGHKREVYRQSVIRKVSGFFFGAKSRTICRTDGELSPREPQVSYSDDFESKIGLLSPGSASFYNIYLSISKC